MKEVKGGYIRNSNSNEMKLVGVMKQGYGIIPKMIMKDKNLSIEAKAIYAYFSSYAGAGNTAFPSVSLICSDLNISEKRFRKHREMLVKKGYLQIKRYRTENGFSKNIYTLSNVVSGQNVSVQNVSVQNVPVQNVSIQNVSVQNDSTNNNSINNNSLNNNRENNNNDYDNIRSIDTNNSMGDEKILSSSFSELVKLYEELIPGSLNSFVAQKLNQDFEEYGLDLMIKAFEIAALNNKRNYNYISGILRNWKNKGITSIEDLELHEGQRKQEVEKTEEELQQEQTLNEYLELIDKYVPVYGKEEDQ